MADSFLEVVFYNKHYILIDSHSRIIDGWSDGPHPERDTAGAVCINDQGGYQFQLPTGEINPNWLDEYGIPLYKWDGSSVVQRTDEEIDADSISYIRGYIHFITVNENSRIVSGWSTGASPSKTSEDAIVLRRGGSFEFRLFQDGEDNPELFTYDGIPMYVYIDGKVFKLSNEGIENERQVRGLKSYTELQQENTLLKSQIQVLSDRNDFIEDCLAEMAVEIYTQ